MELSLLSHIVTRYAKLHYYFHHIYPPILLLSFLVS